MKTHYIAASLALMLGLQGCDNSSRTENHTANPATKTVSAEQSADQTYLNLVDQYFKDVTKLNPMYATFVGIDEHNDRFGNGLTEAYLKARHELNTKYLDAVKALDRDKLSDSLQLSFDMFAYDKNMALIGEKFPERFIPINQFYSPVITMIQLASGESAQPFKTVADYNNWLSRMDGFIAWLGDVKLRMNQGIESKVVLPRVLVERMIPQFKSQLVQNAEDSLFYTPIRKLPDTLSDKDKQEITLAYQTQIQSKLMPALQDFTEYLEGTYLENARGSDGWSGLPNGKAWYQHLANHHTTTKMPVDEIHQVGLVEVKRILSEMDRVREQVGFVGTLPQFFEALSSEEQYFFESKEALIQGYMEAKQRINAVLPDYFNVMPKADYVVKPVESFREKSAAGASYESPAVDGSRPGIFYINTYNLKAQPKWGVTTLSLHEAAPGHHFQIAIKQELQGVPEFQRFSGYNAFEEGWALYAEYLGIEMGLFKDPYQYFGKLSDEMLRAMRLVVDTGLHAKGWSREQAIQYMMDNSPLADSDIVAEVERYMAIPGQALSYKVGQLKILELRERAEKKLGDNFDLKDFHAQLLTSGSLPMAVMEQKIDRWIAQQSKS